MRKPKMPSVIPIQGTKPGLEPGYERRSKRPHIQLPRISRRKLLSAVPVVVAAKALPQPHRPQIAAVVTEYRKWSHAQHILDRFLWGYGWEGSHHLPPMDLVSVYVDQVKANDLSRGRAQLFPSLKLYPSIAEALCRGGSKLAVDGVLLIGEHGNYPVNEKGQTLYPRYEFFKQIVEVFRQSGRSVPVFNDKHLSWRWDWAREMVDTARQMKFPFMAGSSLPVTWRIPSVEMPLGAEIEEVMCVCVGGVDSYDFHGLETIQCMVERRRGGESGVVAIHALRGERVWEALRAGSWQKGGWDMELFEACLCRSHTLTPAREGFNHVYPTLDEIPKLVKKPLVYRYEYADGLKASMMLMEGVVNFSFAARFKKKREILSTEFYLPVGTSRVANFFNPLVHHIEQMFLTGKASYPVERTLLTTGLVAAGVESLWRGQTRLETPHLSVRYQPNRESTFWRT